MSTANNLSSFVTRVADEFNTVRIQKANTANTLAGYGITDAYTKSQTDGAITQATSGLALSNKVLNLQAPTNPSTTAVIAPALSTIGTTNGYVINLSFGNFDEVGPIVFNEKWQLQVVGPSSATTTAVTVKNGITIQNSNGVRLTRIQIEGTSSISCRAGLGLHFERDQFMGPLTLGGTGGFMMFTDCEFGGNVTISPTFAGVVYFIRCAFSGASATYTFGQSSAFQVLVSDSSGVPNTGFVSGSTPKAAYSGSIIYKNNTQAQFINNIPVSTLGAANNQVLKFNGVAFAPANDSVTDTTKLPLAGGTMTGAIAMSNNKVTGLGAPTANTDAVTKTYVDVGLGGKLSLSGGTVNGDLVVTGSSLSLSILPNDGTFNISDGTSTTDISPTSMSIITANGSAIWAQGGVLSLYSDINTTTAIVPTQPYHATTKEYVDNTVSWKVISSESNTSGTKSLDNSASWNTVKSSYNEVMFVGVTGNNVVSSSVVPTDMIVANYSYNTPRNDLDYVTFNGLTNLANGSFTTTFNGSVVSTIIYAR